MKKGGHGIPDDIIEERYNPSIKNLKRVIPLCEKVIIYDNSDGFKKVGVFKKGSILWIDKTAEVTWFKENVLKKLNRERSNSFAELYNKRTKRKQIDERSHRSYNSDEYER